MQVTLQEEKKKKVPPLCPTIPSWAFRGGRTGDSPVCTPTPTKGLWCSGGRDWKLTDCLPGSWLRVAHLGPEPQTLPEKKKWEHKGRDSQRERQKEKLLGCYSLIWSPFLWWSHLLREGECSANTKAWSTLVPLLLLRIIILQRVGETTEGLKAASQSNHSYDQKSKVPVECNATQQNSTAIILFCKT